MNPLGQVTLSLTPGIVQQLFAEKPHLHRAHTAMVPERLSEKEFWERYFNYEVARKVSFFSTCGGGHSC